MKAPKEITESYPFIIHKGCIYQYKGEVPEGATVLNAPNIDTAMGYLSEESVKEMLAEKDGEIPKWIPVTTKPEFDGEYLCLVMESEQCGATYTKQRVLCNSFNTWMTLANQSVLFWMPLPKQP